MKHSVLREAYYPLSRNCSLSGIHLAIGVILVERSERKSNELLYESLEKFDDTLNESI